MGAGVVPRRVEARELLVAAEECRGAVAELRRGDPLRPGGAAILTASADAIGRYIRYLGEHIDSVSSAVRAGRTLEETLAGLPLDESYLPPEGSPLAVARPAMKGFHLWNVKKTYLELTQR